MAIKPCRSASNEGRDTVSVQTSAEARRQYEQNLIDRFGVAIGSAEWKEIRDFCDDYSAEVSKKLDYFAEKDIEVPAEYMERIAQEREFLNMVRLVHEYMYSQQSKMSDFSGVLREYWIVNPAPSQYMVSYNGNSLEKTVASYQELMGFLALGVARGCWTIQDALEHVVTECMVQKLLEAN